MNYERIYAAFIADRLLIEPDLKRSGQYCERHHIIPRSIGGGDGAQNIISLTAEDHIHAHIFLARIHGGKMWGAALLMTKKTVGCKRTYVRSPTKNEIRAAAFSRKMFSLHCRGENHSQYGRKHTDGAKGKMSAAHKARAVAGLMWTQQNAASMSGVGHWTKQAKNASALERAIPIFKANLQKAVIANTGAGNPMYRLDVAEKVGTAVRTAWANGVGVGSELARARHVVAHNSPKYLAAAKARVLGEKNHNFGRAGGMNYNSRQVLCVETDHVFASVKDAAEFCGGDVTKATRTGGKAGGYTWKRLTPHSTDGMIAKNGGAKKETGSRR